jgi:Cu(I)/Ag(I) efflux system membrane protein CusA/SilA
VTDPASHRRIEKTATPCKPLADRHRRNAVKKVGPALLFSLAIIAVSFLPVFVLESQEGRLFKPLSPSLKPMPWPQPRCRSRVPDSRWATSCAAGSVLNKKNPLNGDLDIPPVFWNAAVAWPWATILLAVDGIAAAADQDRVHARAERGGDFLYMPSLYPGVSIRQSALRFCNRQIGLLPQLPEVF